MTTLSADQAHHSHPASPSTPASADPLRGLSADEIVATREVLTAAGLVQESTRFVYVGVDDITATLAKVTARGGTIRFPRFEVPGRVVLAVFNDPAGNSIGLVEMENGKTKVPR